MLHLAIVAERPQRLKPQSRNAVVAALNNLRKKDWREAGKIRICTRRMGYEVSMRGDDRRQEVVFSYLNTEQRIPADHPLRGIRVLLEGSLQELSLHFDALYARRGRPSIAPERLLRALLLMVLYSIRSERQLMEQIDFNLLYRWFVGLNPDDEVWDVTVFTKNRKRFDGG